jgi:hypothetical protein
LPDKEESAIYRQDVLDTLISKETLKKWPFIPKDHTVPSVKIIIL